MRDRGVSEVISFALVFSLIVATVALVYVSGIGGLEATRSGEQVNNAERAFDVLADNIQDIHREGAPSRATEVKLSDAQMEFGDSTRINITIRNKAGDNVSVVEYDPIVYSADSGTDLTYANGALFREDRSGTVLNREPSFLLSYDSNSDRKTMILPVIQTRTAGPKSLGGQRTVLVRTLLATREVTIAQDDPSTAASDPDGDTASEFNVTIRVQPPEQRRGVWKDYLNGLVDDAESGNSATFDVRESSSDACEVIDVSGVKTIECNIAAEDVYSTVTRIDVVYR
jgi:hypothetical protein